MRKADLMEYRMRLLEMSKRLNREIEELDRTIGEGREARGDLADFGTHTADHDSEFLGVGEAVERNEVGLLNEVEAALARIERGTYGQCSECGGQIQRARLEALPYAARCVDCERARG